MPLKLMEVPDEIKSSKGKPLVKCWLTDQYAACTEKCSLCPTYQDYAAWCDKRKEQENGNNR